MADILREVPYKDVMELREEYLGGFAAIYTYFVEVMLLHDS